MLPKSWNLRVVDMDVTRLGEKSTVVRDIVHACDLPVLVDCDDGYGDEKNVVHTIHTYDDLGVSAVFIEDQKAPKKCGHMRGKKVIEREEYIDKIRAAVEAAAGSDFFIVARTDALAPVEAARGPRPRSERGRRAAALRRRCRRVRPGGAPRQGRRRNRSCAVSSFLPPG